MQENVIVSTKYQTLVFAFLFDFFICIYFMFIYSQEVHYHLHVLIILKHTEQLQYNKEFLNGLNRKTNIINASYNYFIVQYLQPYVHCIYVQRNIEIQ